MTVVDLQKERSLRAFRHVTNCLVTRRPSGGLRVEVAEKLGDIIALFREAA